MGGYRFMNNLPDGCSQADIDEHLEGGDWCSKCELHLVDCGCDEPDPPGLDDYLDSKR
jgi:hypothetical protein